MRGPRFERTGPAAPITLIRALSVLLFLGGCTGKAIPVEAGDEPIAMRDENAHREFTEVLKTYVRDGRVEYPGICADPRFDVYLGKLAATDPDAIHDRAARLAFWINVYNAFTIKIVCDNYPIKSINDLHFGGLVLGHVFKKTVWDKEFIVISGRKMSLNHIEHQIIRKEFDEPRAHFAIVCASRSCPPLRKEAYEAERLDGQLEDQALIFFGDPRWNAYDLERRKARISKILDWYGGDFGENKKQRFFYISRFLPDAVNESYRADPDAWDISYMKYDWGLND